MKSVSTRSCPLQMTSSRPQKCLSTHNTGRVPTIFLYYMDLCPVLVIHNLEIRPSFILPLNAYFTIILFSWPTSLWKISLWRLYEDILLVMGIPSKPEMVVQGIQVKPETPKTWIPLCSSLHSYLKFFYKFITYCMFHNNYNIDT